MRILGIDTATWRASVGFISDATDVVEQSLLTTGNHAATLLPLIEDVLRRAVCPVNELDAIAVSNGPGSFTGLRVGLMSAKALAYALGVRGENRYRIGRGLVFDRRGGRLDGRCFER